MRSALPAVIIACAATLLLGGCVPQEPVVVPPVEQQSEPVFASDEEALAAATDAYKAYLEMSDLIAQEGGKDPERIAPFVTEEWLEQELTQLQAFRSDGLRQIGSSSFDSVNLQQLDEGEGLVRVSVYLCLDITDAEVVNARGDEISIDRKRWPFEVSFVQKFVPDSTLVLGGHEAWSGTNFCS